MKIETRKNENRLLVSIQGSINKLDNFEVRKNISDNMENVSALDIDMAGVCFLDSGFINLVFELVRTHGDKGVKIRLLNPNENIQELFSVTRLHRACEIVGQEDGRIIESREV